MTSKQKLAAGAATLVAVGGVTGGAIAATGSSPSRQAFLNDAAHRVGVSPQQLQSGMQQAYLDQLNAAVASGRISSAQAAKIKQRIQQHGGMPWLALGRHHGRQNGPLRVAARYLGMTRAQLVAQLRSGKSLAQVAQARNKSVSGLQNALVDAARKRLDTAVSRGRITKAQEQRRLTKLQTRIGKLIQRQGLHMGARRG